MNVPIIPNIAEVETEVYQSYLFNVIQLINFRTELAPSAIQFLNLNYLPQHYKSTSGCINAWLSESEILPLVLAFGDHGISGTSLVCSVIEGQWRWKLKSLFLGTGSTIGTLKFPWSTARKPWACGVRLDTFLSLCNHVCAHTGWFKFSEDELASVFGKVAQDAVKFIFLAFWVLSGFPREDQLYFNSTNRFIYTHGWTCFWKNKD